MINLMVKPTDVSTKARRRRFTTAEKIRILREADACGHERGAVGALLRREGIYSSHLTGWRKQRDAPRIWKQATSITLTHGSTSIVIALARVAGKYGCITRERTWFVCPSCSALAGSLAFPPAFAFDAQRAGCRQCLKWRSRSYRVSGKAPHVRNVVATANDR